MRSDWGYAEADRRGIYVYPVARYSLLVVGLVAGGGVWSWVLYGLGWRGLAGHQSVLLHSSLPLSFEKQKQ